MWKIPINVKGKTTKEIAEDAFTKGALFGIVAGILVGVLLAS